MAEISIIGMEKTFSQEPTRQGKVDRIVLYNTSEDKVTRWVTVPDEGFTLDVAQAAIRKAESERRLKDPIKFTV